MAIPTSFPPQATPSSQPAQARTSGALVLNINAPLSNYAGDTPAGGPSSSINPTAPAIGAGPSADTFQRRNNSPFVPNPAASPKEQLEQSYFNALNARNDAEQARNGYLNLANQLNGQAFQTNQTPQPAPVAPPVQPQVNPAQFQQQLSQLQQMQQAQLQQQQQQFQQQLQQQQAQQDAQTQQLQQQLMQQQQQNSQLQQQQQLMQQQAQQQQLMQQQAQQQQMQQAMAQQQNPYAQMDPMMQQQLQQQQAMAQQANPYAQMDPAMMQQQAQPNMANNLQMMRPEELNALIQGPDQNQKLNAILEFAARQQGNRETYELLKNEAMAPTTQLPPGQAQEDGNLIRQAALFALGNLNRAQNSQVETAQLPGLDAINNILKNPQESPAVKAAAVTSLGYIDRPQDKVINALLSKAAKDPSQDVKNAVQQVKSGMMSAANQAQAAAAAAQQGMMPQPGIPQYS
jgi:hypothetical protein